MTEEHPVWVPEFFADTILVNGKVWPHLTVEPRKYRFRILNGSNARFYTLRLAAAATLPSHQIGSEGGLLPATAVLDALTLAAGERADVIVDCSAQAGQTFVLRNAAKTPFPIGTPPDPKTTGQVMQFRVLPVASTLDASVVPLSPRPLTRLEAVSAARVRDVELVEHLDENGERVTALIDDKMWRDATDMFAKLGATDVCRVINTTGDTHPIHLHLVQFQVLDRPTSLEHEDNDMMRPFEVRPATKSAAGAAPPLRPLSASARARTARR
ncbi:MAG: multicopper oxidase domain-containing protein [Actinomycetota bacterium]|nr:multicopper oxidase domain-containing protein [Actinomycetota bacterium]